jgi:hypothetical protein
VRCRGSHIFQTDGGEVASLACRPPFTHQEDSWYCYRLSRPQSHSSAGRIRSTEKSNDLIRNRTRNLPGYEQRSKFEVITVMVFKTVVFWIETSRGFVIGYRYFGKNVLSPSSRLKCVRAEVSLVMQASYKG